MDPQTKVLSRRTVGLRSWTISRTMNEGSMRDNRGRAYSTIIAHRTDGLQLFANSIAYDYRRFSIFSFLLNQPVSRSSTDFLILIITRFLLPLHTFSALPQILIRPNIFRIHPVWFYDYRVALQQPSWIMTTLTVFCGPEDYVWKLGVKLRPIIGDFDS